PCAHLLRQSPCPTLALQVRLHCSQGGVQFPTGGKGRNAKPASAFRPKGPWGQQIRCNSGADGIVRMKENGTKRLAGCARCFGSRSFRRVVSRNPEETGYGKDDR